MPAFAHEGVNEQMLEATFSFLPGWLADFCIAIVNPFVGGGWHLTLGALFMLVVIFLPGGIMEGVRRIKNLFHRGKADGATAAAGE